VFFKGKLANSYSSVVKRTQKNRIALQVWERLNCLLQLCSEGDLCVKSTQTAVAYI